MRRLFNTKVRIEKLEETLLENNTWKSEYVFWKDVWASIQLKNVTVNDARYLFIMKWKGDFPKKFRVIINGRIFMPTQKVVIDFQNDLIIFQAK